MAGRDVPDEGWTEAGAKWLNGLSVESFVDLKMLLDYGVQDEEDQQKLEALRESYEQETGESWD